MEKWKNCRLLALYSGGTMAHSKILDVTKENWEEPHLSDTTRRESGKQRDETRAKEMHK